MQTDEQRQAAQVFERKIAQQIGALVLANLRLQQENEDIKGQLIQMAKRQARLVEVPKVAESEATTETTAVEEKATA